MASVAGLLPPRAPIDDSDAAGWSLYRERWHAYETAWRAAHSDRSVASRPAAASIAAGEIEDAWIAYTVAWKAHWAALGDSWRVMPEICRERQDYLKNCLDDCARQRAADGTAKKYPFEGEHLRRADLEWLLSHHHNGDWLSKMLMHRFGTGDPKRGLDLRGAIVRDWDFGDPHDAAPIAYRRADLHRLPLAELNGGLDRRTWDESSPLERQRAAVDLQDAELRQTCLRFARLRGARLERANLECADLNGACLRGARLEQADLNHAYVDHATSLRGVDLTECDSVLDIHWGAVDLGSARWSEPVGLLGDERRISHLRRRGRGRHALLEQYRDAIRANRQLSLVLQSQGVGDVADHFAYRAQTLQRQRLALQWLDGRSDLRLRLRLQAFSQWLLSCVLWLGGYGQRFGRLVVVYLLTILAFAVVYQFTPPASLGAGANHVPAVVRPVLTSIVDFHGRSLLAIETNATDIADYLALLEAMIGLGLEAIAVGMLVQRFMSKSGS